jgi:predicted transcriptional regulator
MNKPRKDRSTIKSEPFGLVISTREKQRAERVAKKEDLSLSALARKAIREYCDRHEQRERMGKNG